MPVPHGNQQSFLSASLLQQQQSASSPTVMEHQTCPPSRQMHVVPPRSRATPPPRSSSPLELTDAPTPKNKLLARVQKDVASSSPLVCSVDDAHDQVLKYFADPNVDLLEQQFCDDMLANGLEVVFIDPDGMCLYEAIGTTLGKSGLDLHTHAMSFISNNAEFFAPFLTEPVDVYVSRKSQLHTVGAFGNHIELLACTCVFNIIIHVHETDGSYNAIDPFECPLYMSEMGLEPTLVHVWHHGGHYDALIPVT